jgi:hypothetical protein
VVAFTTACVILLLLTSVGVIRGRRRPVGTPLTWGEAMVAAVYVFLVMFWAYGMVPHLWLAWADGDLHMTPNRLFAVPRYKATDATLKWPLPITVSYQTLRDIIVVGIYGVVLTANIVAWPLWHNRGKKKPVALVKSDFGRPLVREGAN